MIKRILLVIAAMLVLAGCTGGSKDALAFKEDYEKLNGQETASGKLYREITIDPDNPFVYADCADIVKMMDEGQTFIVYFGANWCPWCRSVLPTFISKAKENKINTVYYVDLKPDNDEEKEIRNVYAVDENGVIYRSHEGTEAYNQFIKKAAAVLADYQRSDVESLDGTEWEGEKRVGAPNFVLVVNGEAVDMTLGISLQQDDPYMELTADILEDVADIFQKLMTEYLEAK